MDYPLAYRGHVQADSVCMHHYSIPEIRYMSFLRNPLQLPPKLFTIADNEFLVFADQLFQVAQGVVAALYAAFQPLLPAVIETTGEGVVGVGIVTKRSQDALERSQLVNELAKVVRGILGNFVAFVVKIPGKLGKSQYVTDAPIQA